MFYYYIFFKLKNSSLKCIYSIYYTISNIHSETTIFLLSTTTFVAQLFVIYNRDVPFVTRSVPDYYFSLGRIMLSRIATIAAGTIPEPPKTSWSS